MTIDHACILAASYTAQCPPCHGGCNQGRQCSANTPAEASTEVGADELDHGATALFWTLYVAVFAVAVIAGIAALI